MLALVTATKNSIRTIREALESAASFRHKVKHDLIDAASSDGTRKYLESFLTTTGHSVLLQLGRFASVFHAKPAGGFA